MNNTYLEDFLHSVVNDWECRVTLLVPSHTEQGYVSIGSFSPSCWLHAIDELEATESMKFEEHSISFRNYVGDDAFIFDCGHGFCLRMCDREDRLYFRLSALASTYESIAIAGREL